MTNRFEVMVAGTTPQSTLPPGHWDSVPYGDAVVYVCPDHQPRILKDGLMSILEFKDGPVDPLIAWATFITTAPIKRLAL